MYSISIKKKDGTLRLCQDYQGLNERFVSGSGGIGDIKSIFDRRCNQSVFSTIDLASDFFQPEIEESERYKTVFCDTDGLLWDYNRADFGLKCLSAAFASHVGLNLRNLKHHGVKNGLDDTLVASPTFEGYLLFLEDALTRLRDNSVSVKLRKSIWFAP